MSEKQPNIWKDQQKLCFKNSKEMLYTIFFMTRFSTSHFFLKSEKRIVH